MVPGVRDGWASGLGHLRTGRHTIIQFALATDHGKLRGPSGYFRGQIEKSYGDWNVFCYILMFLGSINGVESIL